MKGRVGFVSNSSSSSFVVVGLPSRRIFNRLLESANLTEERLWDWDSNLCIDHGQYRVNGIDIIWGEDDDPIIGLDISSRFQKGHGFKRIYKELITALDKMGIQLLPGEKVGFHHGAIHG